MSGPSATQIQLQNEQAQFYQEATTEAKAAFGEQQSLLDEITKVYEPILARGPNTNAFAGPEQEALDAQAVEGTAANFNRAAKAVGETAASDNPVSGAVQQREEQVALSSAAEESTEETQILESGYAAGAKEFEEAGAALSTASGQLSPTSYNNAATGAGSAAEATAAAINQEENSWEAPVLGAVGAIGGGLLGNPNLFKPAPASGSPAGS